MLFNSYSFIFLFLPISFFYFFLISKSNIKNLNLLFLILISFLFYSFWNKIYVFLLLGSICGNFIFAKTIIAFNDNNKIKIKKIIFVIGVSLNVLLLGYFKYFNFFIENINLLFESSFAYKNIILPLAISFFTVQQINFLIEIYFNKNKDFKFLKYFLFVSFFPQLVAGPIVTYSDLIPQFEKDKLVNIRSNIILGLIIFTIGLFKKVVLADSIGFYADELFKIKDFEQNLNFIDVFIGSLAFTFQIYFDFSGYSDMAIGLARIFSIKLPINFKSPYKSKNIILYWKAWHITFTSFITTKIYLPLNLFFTKKIINITKNKFTINCIGIFLPMAFAFLVSGFWHGASWNFILWGLAHGILLIINHSFVILKGNKNFIPKTQIMKIIAMIYDNYFKVFFTFIVINLVNILFRSEKFEQSLFLYKSFFNFSPLIGIYQNYSFIFIFILILFVIVWFLPNNQELIKQIEKKLNKKYLNILSFKFIYLFIFLLMFIMSLLFMKSSPEFIYFQF